MTFERGRSRSVENTEGDEGMSENPGRQQQEPGLPGHQGTGLPIQIELRNQGSPRLLTGQPLAFSVRITNISKETIWMVGAVPGHEGLRYPHYLAEIEGPGGPEQARLPEDLDYVRGLRVEDFVQLGPGEGFDPQGKGFVPIQQLAWFKAGQPGRYRIRICFDSTEPDPREWLGHTQTGNRAELENLIQKVPKIRAWSNTLEVEFRETL